MPGRHRPDRRSRRLDRREPATNAPDVLDAGAPPRFFEKFLEGRHYSEIPDLVARICGICPVAYQVTAAQALEKLFGVELDPWARGMRGVFYCGEWIQSHSLHIHLLAAPDFFGCNNAIELVRIAPDEVRRGLRIQALGNELMDLFGARSVHPVGVRVGGFHAAPSLARIEAMREKLRAALPEAEALIRWTAGIPLPQDDQAFLSVALQHPADYAIERGDIAASDGLRIAAEAFATRILPNTTNRTPPRCSAAITDSPIWWGRWRV